MEKKKKNERDNDNLLSKVIKLTQFIIIFRYWTLLDSVPRFIILRLSALTLPSSFVPFSVTVPPENTSHGPHLPYSATILAQATFLSG